MSGHVKVGLYLGTESHIRSVLIRYFTKSFWDEQELMKQT